MIRPAIVALRKESVDRNIYYKVYKPSGTLVALRKESVDRNLEFKVTEEKAKLSLSARRAWIEITQETNHNPTHGGRSPQGERG